MKRLEDLLGVENQLDFNSRAIRDFARRQQAASVGAMHVTCSDESERECVESFQHWVTEDLLPSLKYSTQSPFRSANLGGRYEWGSLAIAQEHFATPAARQGFQLLLVKINSHVSVIREGASYRYGSMPRYEDDSKFCGALHALMDAAALPAIDNLGESFRSVGLDRLAMLRDEATVDPHYRSLLAAVVSARLQARRAVLDIQNMKPACPTLFIVLPCVTLNRPDRDTELTVGIYHADLRNVRPDVYYRGLGDDPSAYQVQHHQGLLRITDDQIDVQRSARDHRQIVLGQWQQRREQVLIDQEQVKKIVVLHEQQPSVSASVSKEILKTLLRLLADIALVPTAVTLFADGVVGIHNVYRAYRLAKGTGTPHDATAILDEIMHRVEQLSPDQAQYVIQLLCRHFNIPIEADDEDQPFSPEVSPPAAQATMSSDPPELAADLEMTTTQELTSPTTISEPGFVEEQEIELAVVPEEPAIEAPEIVEYATPAIDISAPAETANEHEESPIIEATLVEIVDETPEIDLANQPGKLQ